MFTDHVDDVDELARRLCDTEVLVLIRERTAIRAESLDRLNRLRLISQRSVYPHIDVEACSRRGVIVSSDLHPGTPSYVDGSSRSASGGRWWKFTVGTIAATLTTGMGIAASLSGATGSGRSRVLFALGLLSW